MTAKRFLAILAMAVLAPALAAAGTVGDRLGCYKVKDTAKRGSISLTVTNAGVTQTCTVRVPANVACLASSVSAASPALPGGGPAATPAGNFLCYRMKCPKPFPPQQTFSDDVGGSRVVKLKGAQVLCAAATPSGAASNPPSNTTTTTVPQGPCDFDSNSRKCVGTCGNGGHCSAVAAGGACECRTQSCGDASAPSCNGFCSQRDEACIFTLTGCSCVSIP